MRVCGYYWGILRGVCGWVVVRAVEVLFCDSFLLGSVIYWNQKIGVLCAGMVM